MHGSIGMSTLYFMRRGRNEQRVCAACILTLPGWTRIRGEHGGDPDRAHPHEVATLDNGIYTPMKQCIRICATPRTTGLPSGRKICARTQTMMEGQSGLLL
jgi:hypothetical protein